MKKNFEEEFHKEVKRPRYRIHTSDYFRENPSLSTKEKKATIKEQRKCDKLIVDFIIQGYYSN